MLNRLMHVPTRRVLGYLGVALVSVPVMGLIFLGGTFGTVFNIDGETEFRWPPWQTRIVIPALISSLLLLCAGWCWLEVSRRGSQRWHRLAAGLFGALLVFMTADEFFGIHEWFNQFGIRWQVLYAPVVAGVGLLLTAYLGVWVRRGVRAPALLITAGVGAWFVAQILEFVEYDGKPPAPGQPVVRSSLYWLYVFLEENLENVGSVLFLFGAVAMAAALGNRSRRSADAPGPVDGGRLMSSQRAAAGPVRHHPADARRRSQDPVRSDRAAGAPPAR